MVGEWGIGKLVNWLVFVIRKIIAGVFFFHGTFSVFVFALLLASHIADITIQRTQGAVAKLALSRWAEFIETLSK